MNMIQIPSALRLFFCILLLASRAYAVLGEDESSVKKSHSRMQANYTIEQKELLSVHKLATPTLQVWEYAYQGKVIAVRWQGIGKPDLQEHLGRHFSKYRRHNVAKGKVPGRRPQHFESEDFVFKSFGHMRNMQGLSYSLPLPAGITESDFN